MGALLGAMTSALGNLITPEAMGAILSIAGMVFNYKIIEDTYDVIKGTLLRRSEDYAEELYDLTVISGDRRTTYYQEVKDASAKIKYQFCNKQDRILTSGVTASSVHLQSVLDTTSMYNKGIIDVSISNTVSNDVLRTTKAYNTVDIIEENILLEISKSYMQTLLSGLSKIPYYNLAGQLSNTADAYMGELQLASAGFNANLYGFGVETGLMNNRNEDKYKNEKAKVSDETNIITRTNNIMGSSSIVTDTGSIEPYRYTYDSNTTGE